MNLPWGVNCRNASLTGVEGSARSKSQRDGKQRCKDSVEFKTKHNEGKVLREEISSRDYIKFIAFGRLPESFPW